jgi:hypothetical protein
LGRDELLIVFTLASAAAMTVVASIVFLSAHTEKSELFSSKSDFFEDFQ